MARRARKPRGKPLPKVTNKTAAVTKADIRRAKRQWREDAPRKYKSLLDATELS